MPPLFGHCPFGWGLNPCPDGLGHFFREEFSKFKRAFIWATYSEKMVKQIGKNGKIAPEKVPQSARLSAGEGV